MAKSNDFLLGLPPRDVDLWQAQADYNADAVLVVIDRANITVAASDTWTYAVPFYLVGENCGKVIPYTGVVGAAVSLTTGSGPVPAVDDASPSVVMGKGTVTVSAGNVGGGSYVATDVATLTITYTTLRGSTDTDTFTVTMS